MPAKGLKTIVISPKHHAIAKNEAEKDGRFMQSWVERAIEEAAKSK